jgi:hypothetical protein
MVDEVRDTDIDYPANMAPLCQSLLYTAKTRFHHVRLRHDSVARSTGIPHLSVAAKRDADVELAQCVAICAASRPALASVGAVCQKAKHFPSLEQVAANRAAWDAAGRLKFVEVADACQVKFLLFCEDDDLTVKTRGLELGMPVLGRMYEVEKARWGPQGRSWNGRWCYLADKLNDWLHRALNMEPTRAGTGWGHVGVCGRVLAQGEGGRHEAVPGAGGVNPRQLCGVMGQGQYGCVPWSGNSVEVAAGGGERSCVGT